MKAINYSIQLRGIRATIDFTSARNLKGLPIEPIFPPQKEDVGPVYFRGFLGGSGREEGERGSFFSGE